MDQLTELVSAISVFLFALICWRFLPRLDRILTLVEISFLRGQPENLLANQRSKAGSDSIHKKSKDQT